MFYLWFLPSKIRSCQIHLGWYSLVINFSSLRVLPMKRHRIREIQNWKGSLSLSNECRSVVLLMGNWNAKKRLRQARGQASQELHPRKNSLHQPRRKLSGPTRPGSSQVKCRPILGEFVVINELWDSSPITYHFHSFLKFRPFPPPSQVIRRIWSKITC